MSKFREIKVQDIHKIGASSPKDNLDQYPSFGTGTSQPLLEGVTMSPLPGLDRLVNVGEQVRLLQNSGGGPHLTGSLLGQLAGLRRLG
jgi:hypothetical protein